MLCLAVWSIFYYAKHRPRQFFTLGLCLDFVVPPSFSDEDKQLNFKLAAGTPSKGEFSYIINYTQWLGGVCPPKSYFARSREQQLNSLTDIVLKRRRQSGSQMNGEEEKSAFHTYDKDLSSGMDNGTHGGYFSPLNIPFLVEMALMALVACFIMHVQVFDYFSSSYITSICTFLSMISSRVPLCRLPQDFSQFVLLYIGSLHTKSRITQASISWLILYGAHFYFMCCWDHYYL